MMNCLMCKDKNEYSWLKIKEGTFWTVSLRNEQNYLGWCVVILKRHLEDLMDISDEERTELFLIVKQLRDVIQEQLKADMFNYASLGNVSNHLHLQVVPRYREEVMFEGATFADKNWGKNYSPYDKTFTVPKAVKQKIKEVIQKNI